MSDSNDAPKAERPRPDEYWQVVGRSIQVHRTARGWDRKELAEKSGLSYPYLSEIEAGRKRPGSRALMEIARALGVSMSDVLELADGLPPDDAAAEDVPDYAGSRQWFHDDRTLRSRAAPRERMREPMPSNRRKVEKQLTSWTYDLPDDDLELVFSLVRRLRVRR